MANLNTQFKPKDLSVTISAATDSKITNYVVPLSNTEYSHALVNGLKQLLIRSREKCTVHFAFVSGESLTKYMTILPGVALNVSDLDFTGKVLYFNCSVPCTLEILEFY